jgi:polysaccharide biosynthesis transport protein
VVRLAIEPPTNQQKSDKSESVPRLLTEVQALTSAALFEKVVQQVRKELPDTTRAAVSVNTLNGMLSAVAIPGTNVIELRGEGNKHEFLARILTAWIEAYRQSHLKAHSQSAVAALEESRSADEQLRTKLAEKRRDLEQYRKRHGIVSLEREENQAMARLKSLTVALNDARTREANAEGRLNAMPEAVAAGKSLDRPNDKAIIANLETRAIDLRERITDLEQDYTPQYLALDGKHKALRANLERLEQQIERTKGASAAQAIQAGEEELTSARRTAVRLREELTTRKQEIQNFTARFAEHSALVNELKSLEDLHNSGKQRLAQLEIESKGSAPRVMVLSAPSVPERPDRPDYWRDALIVILASGALGLTAVWFVEFFKRSGIGPLEPVTHPVIQIAYPSGQMLDMNPAALGTSPKLQLPSSVARAPRELSIPEVRALWDAGSHDARLVIAGLFGGLTLNEVASLRYEQVTPDDGSIRLPGTTNRSMVVRAPLKRLLVERRRSEGALLVDAHGEPLSAADLEGLIACAACDAGLAYPTEVSAEVLRHTYVAYLIRQGARLIDVAALIGGVPSVMLRDYGHLSLPGPGLPLEQVEQTFPALRA